MKKYREALDDYNVALSYNWNDFSENSARRGANISMELKDYSGAYGYFQKLRANMADNSAAEFVFLGLTKNGYNSGKYNDAMAYADTLGALPGISPESANEAEFYKAKSLQMLDKDDDAIVIYRKMSENKNGEIAAEARYHIAEILLKQDKLKDAETAANEAIKLSAGYDDWVGKSYLLLTDVLVKEKDYFNAKALLQSIVKHTKSADLKQEAAKKLEEVKKIEKSHSKLSEE
jgi:tetratricopeptide (TPR) repeat protein